MADLDGNHIDASVKLYISSETGCNWCCGQNLKYEIELNVNNKVGFRTKSCNLLHLKKMSSPYYRHFYDTENEHYVLFKKNDNVELKLYTFDEDGKKYLINTIIPEFKTKRFTEYGRKGINKIKKKYFIEQNIFQYFK